MLVDKPLTAIEILRDENERERMMFLLRTINTLAKDNQHGSVSVSINGDWGSGKTTYLRLIESYYRDSCKFPVVFYEAWRYRDDENPLIPLIMEIHDILGTKSGIKKGLSMAIKSILASGIAFSDICLNAITGKGIETVEKALQLIEKEQLHLISRYRNNLKSLSGIIAKIKDNYTAKGFIYEQEWLKIKDNLPKFNGKRLFVLIIDDLDRLLPENAFRVIETLRFYFDIDDVLIVMGINDEILNKFIMEHYGVKDDKRGERFLEKIFHWNYELSYTKLTNLHLRSLAKIVEDKEDIDNIKKILSIMPAITHRKWIKIINRIENGCIVEGSSWRDVMERLIFSAFIKELYPEFEIFSRRFPRVLEHIYEGKDEDDVVKEALKKIKEDKSYLDFPEENFNTIKEVTKPITV